MSADLDYLRASIARLRHTVLFVDRLLLDDAEALYGHDSPQALERRRQLERDVLEFTSPEEVAA